MIINKYTLSNGLKLIHQEDRDTTMVGISVLYDVGAKDEDPEKTGFAHLFEHLMFGGSINIPDYDSVLESAGGENNAWTNNDMTCYYLSIPSQNVETAFWLESDRMLSLNFSDQSLNVQKQVVMEEFKQTTLNRPYGDVQHLMRELSYTKHPYRWPTIGKDLSHIENATLDDVKHFFYDHYAPNNAILSVCGNISFEKTLSLANKWFAPIDKRPIKIRNLQPEPKQLLPRFLEVQRKVPVDAIYKSYHIYDRLHPDYYICDMLSDLLASGRSSRLFQQLVMKKRLFTEINAYVSGEVEEGSLLIYGKPIEGLSLKQADQAIENELEKLKEDLIETRELNKVKNKYESNHLFSNINYLNRSTNLAVFELLGDASMIDSEVSKYREITVKNVQNVAKNVFNPNNCSTIYYKSVQND